MLTGHETLQQAAFSCLELTFVPVCSRQAGEGRRDARPALLLPGCLQSHPARRLPASLSRAHMSSLRNRELSALENTQGQTREQQFAASQLETAAI